MSAWVGIESTPADSSPPSARRSDVTTAGSADQRPRDRTPAQRVGGRRMRRQQRPIIGSIDAAGAMTQRHAREVIAGAAVIILPGVAINLFAATLAFDRYQSFSGAVVSVPELLGGAEAATGIEEVLWFVGLLINSLSTCLVGGYVATLVVRHHTGLPPTIGSGLGAVVRHSPALFIAWACGHCWIVLGGWILRSVSGAGLGPLIIFGSPVVLILITLTVVVAPAIVIERLGPMAGLRRSWRLARAGFSTLFGFTLCSVVVGLVVQYGIAYLPRLLQQTGLITFGRFGWLIEGAAGQLGRLVSTPLIAVATALVYLETRMNLEGMDLVLDADRAFGERT